ncbi:ATP-binding protein [Mycobacterium sp. 4D054]|uniref:ATP-binding protein n=1 Tax=Mycobacterium sp. 4D054 TaxID=3457440 RepID=UPI003FD213FF
MTGAQILLGREVALDEVSRIVNGAQRGEGRVVLVTGSAGMGKTSLLRAALRSPSQCVVGWGTCLYGGAAPGFWPWTHALNGIVRRVGVDAARAAAGADLGLVATVASALGEPAGVESSSRGRMLMLDATLTWLQTLAADRGLVVVLDDLQWTDDSSLELLELAAAAAWPSSVSVIGAYRHDDLEDKLAERLTSVRARAEHVRLHPLAREAAAQLATLLTGKPLADPEVSTLLRRAGGHPLFLRELALAAADGSPANDIPSAIREAIDRRARRLDPRTSRVLGVAALAGSVVLPDVVAATLGCARAEVEQALAEAVAAGVLTSTSDGTRFAHDLYREVLAAGVAPAERPSLHLAVGRALATRAERVAGVAPSEVARHFRFAVGIGAIDEAVRWALRAARADRASSALAEAAEHLRLLRGAVADAAVVPPAGVLVEVLLVETDLLARDGRAAQARDLLAQARTTARHGGDTRASALVALAAVGLGSQFATRRDEITAELEDALNALPDAETALRAKLASALARQLTHSVAEERTRAREFAEEALTLGRTTGDPDVLADCLLARHDVLWTPGAAAERAEVTVELVGLARRSGDAERLAEMLLLHANALLENGRVSFDATLDECLALLEQQGQLRHRYTVATRRAFRALLHGELKEADSLIDTAVALGERLGEPDTHNVRMSQRLELVRARAAPTELVAFADEAVRHWTGAPVHAHAVAAGFNARAGDLDAASRHVSAVQDLGTWRAERSYLWSVFVRELAVAAVAVDERVLCEELLTELEPLADSCGVNGALVAFAGSHAHTAGRLAAALGQPDRAKSLLAQACRVYERLGAWTLAEARTDLEAAQRDGATPATRALRRRDLDWEVTYDGQTAVVRDCKGMHDIAVLVRQPGVEVHVLDLMAAGVTSDDAGQIHDHRAASEYRRRLAALADLREEAMLIGDASRLARIDEEHDALVAELRTGTGFGGRQRSFANNPAERARKAVAGRIRDALRRLEPVLPHAAAHLDQNLVTGIRCRYRGEARWQVDG